MIYVIAGCLILITVALLFGSGAARGLLKAILGLILFGVLLLLGIVFLAIIGG